MANPTSYSLNDLMLAFYANALGLPIFSPIPASVASGINDSTDQITSGPVGGITAVNANLLTGVATAGSTLQFPVALVGQSNLSIQVQGAFVGTLVVQVSNDNVNWNSINAASASSTSYINIATSAGTNAITGPGVFTANVGSFAYVRITCSAYTSGTPTIFLKVSDTGSQVFAALVGSAANIGTVGLFATTLGTATTQAKILTAATTNATLLKSSNAKLFSVILSNNAAAARYIHFHNKATAPVPGTDSPAFTLTLPANTIGQVFQVSSDIGIAFGTGLGISITAAAGDLDATVTVANDVTGVVAYI